MCNHAPIAISPKALPADGGQLSERELRAWRGLLRVHGCLSKALDAQLDAEHRLPLVSYEVLGVLAESDGEKMRMCDLATSVVLSRSGLTRLVDRLERDGLLARETCASDARGAFAKLTPAGRTKLQDARATHLALIRALFLEHVTAEEQEVLAGVWERVLGGLGRSAGCGC